MQTHLQLLIAFGMLVTTAGAAVLFEEDFSGSLKPGTSNGTRSPSTDSAFASTWGMTSILEQEAGNQYARFDFTITAQPTSPLTRWYGGSLTRLGTFTTLPPGWRLTFDLFVNAVEPVRVELRRQESTSRNLTTWIYWVQPAAVGWQSIQIDHDWPYTVELGSGSQSMSGTWLHVGLRSHDAQDNPLSISAIGTYAFFLDHIVLEEVPRPQVLMGDGSFGVRTNQFGFTATGTDGAVVVVDACTNLVSPAWAPVGNNTLGGGTWYFSDPEWTNRPVRFYRLRSP